ncbi:MAG: rRNA maturation RNase YbeY [Candidatus Marinimicrobia bacterium]|nr:rRNA maturation RNase YbeY [Candidatus Neomarinimicrobiota bacterium]
MFELLVIDITVINDYGDTISVNDLLIKKNLENLLKDQDVLEAKISVILSNKFLLNKLKKNYFNVDQFTDVITFNLEDENDPIDGEVYISIDDVLDNAKKYEQSFNLEFKRVLVHGALHLLGFEDNTKDKKSIMTQLENKYIALDDENIISII